MTSVAQHLKERHVDASNYHLTIDEEERVATFMLFNLSGALCGFQQYRPDADKKAKNNAREGRYFTYRVPGNIAVFGLETYKRPGPLFMTEGIFDAVRLHNRGLAAIATLSNNPEPIGPWLRSLSRAKVAICDPGVAGRFLARYGDQVLTCPGAEDLGAMTSKQVDDLLGRWM